MYNENDESNQQGNFSGMNNSSSGDNGTASTNNANQTGEHAQGDNADSASYGSSSYSNYNYGSQPGSNNSYGSYDYSNSASGSNTSSSDNSGNTSYTSYGNYQYTSGQQYQNQSAPNKPKKMGIFGKILLVVGVGVVLGACVGAGLWAASNFKGNSDEIGEIVAKASDSAADAISSADSAAESASEDTSGITTTTSTDNTAVVTDVTEVVKNVMPALVAIDNSYTETVQSVYGSVQQAEATVQGSGIIIGKSDTELLIVTNNHVIDDSDTLKVHFIDDTTADADVKGTDTTRDLAVIAVNISDLNSDTISQIAIATLGDSDKLQVGEPAIAIGNALGYGQSVTTGVISALNREIQTSDDGTTSTFIQTDAAINMGNSGGALLNSRGEVIGINSNKIGGTTIEGLGFAIPISDVKDTIDEMMNQETRKKTSDDNKGYMGISVMTPTGVEGAYVAEVEEGGPAETAGMQVGDIITKLNDINVSSRDDLLDEMKYHTIGETVTVTVLRKGEDGYSQVELSIKLEKGTSTTTTTTTDGTQSSDGQDGSQYYYQMPGQGDQSGQSGQSQTDPFSQFFGNGN